jgi:hypothetical protein
LIQHLPVLRSHTNQRLEVALALKRLNQGAKLDRFGPRAENNQYARRERAFR